MELHRYHDVNRRGTVERLCYTTKDVDGTAVSKYANVYLPYGYSASQKYPTLYLIHGGGGNPDAWLDCSMIKNALDASFAENRCKPFITVFPGFYNRDPVRNGSRPDENAERAHVLFFQQELRNDLIPAVENAFSACACRECRAIGGFSMGGVTTWFAFLENPDLFSVFLPLSGDCWQICGLGGGKETEKTVRYLHDHTVEQGYTKDDFRIYAGTGVEDIAYPNLTPQIEAMKKYTDLFEFSERPEEGNLHYTLMENAPHMYEKVYQHIYHYMPALFPGKVKIRKVTDEDKKRFLPLLLLADEQEDMIDRYLDRGVMYILTEEDQVRGECVVTDEDGGILEIKNLAVLPEWQGHGYGRMLIDDLADRYQGQYRILQVGTGDSPLTLPFYERCGFVRHHVIRDFFTDNYDHPIIEAGKQLRDMIVLWKHL